MSKFCFSGKVVSEFSLLNPQNNKKPLATYFSVGGLSTRVSSSFTINSNLIGA